MVQIICDILQLPNDYIELANGNRLLYSSYSPAVVPWKN